VLCRALPIYHHLSPGQWGYVLYCAGHCYRLQMLLIASELTVQMHTHELKWMDPHHTTKQCCPLSFSGSYSPAQQGMHDSSKPTSNDQWGCCINLTHVRFSSTWMIHVLRDRVCAPSLYNGTEPTCSAISILSLDLTHLLIWATMCTRSPIWASSSIRQFACSPVRTWVLWISSEWIDFQLNIRLVRTCNQLLCARKPDHRSI